MSVIVEPEARKQGIEWVQSFHRLSAAKKSRVIRLYQSMSITDNEKEQDEIALAIVEIVLPKSIGLNGLSEKAVPLDDDIDPTDAAAVAGYHAEIGRIVRQLREEMGWSQQELASRSELPDTHIGRLETGQHAPTNLTIEKIAKALKVPPSTIDVLHDA